MNINTLFLVSLTLVEFGTIMYLLFKIDFFQKNVKILNKELLFKNFKIADLNLIIKKNELNLKGLEISLKSLIDFKEELVKENEAVEKKLKFLENEMLKISVAKKEAPKVEEKPVDKVVEKLRKKRK